MSFFVSQRLGRGVFVGTRVGPWFVVFIGLMWVATSVAMLSVKLLAGLFAELAGAYAEHQRTGFASRHRAAVARGLVRDAVGVDAGTVRREGLVVWAVYGIGARFIPGRYPADEERLPRLYPQEASAIATVGLYPTASSAGQVARGLRRWGYTVNELAQIFGVQSAGPDTARRSNTASRRIVNTAASRTK